MQRSDDTLYVYSDNDCFLFFAELQIISHFLLCLRVNEVFPVFLSRL